MELRSSGSTGWKWPRKHREIRDEIRGQMIFQQVTPQGLWDEDFKVPTIRQVLEGNEDTSCDRPENGEFRVSVTVR
jgi:hypothetical protein